MIMKSTTTPTSVRQGNQATTPHLVSRSRQTTSGHLTLVLTLAVIVLAIAWGLYESLHLLATGLMPRF